MKRNKTKVVLTQMDIDRVGKLAAKTIDNFIEADYNKKPETYRAYREQLSGIRVTLDYLGLETSYIYDREEDGKIIGLRIIDTDYTAEEWEEPDENTPGYCQ